MNRIRNVWPAATLSLVPVVRFVSTWAGEISWITPPPADGVGTTAVVDEAELGPWA